MSTNLFSGSGAGGAVVEEGVAPKNVIGRSYARTVGRRPDLYTGIDIVGARTTNMAVSVTTDYAMPVAQAAIATSVILKRCALHVESDALKFNFVQAMLLCYALNGSSQAMPGRATFTIHSGQSAVGEGATFNFRDDVIAVLGDDARRYFRAYADETRIVLRHLQRRFRDGPQGSSQEEADSYAVDCDAWSAVERIAESKGLSRVPDLIHDSSDSCAGLTKTELSYLAASKLMVLSGSAGGNPVDNPVAARANIPSARVGVVAPSVAASAHHVLGDAY